MVEFPENFHAIFMFSNRVCLCDFVTITPISGLKIVGNHCPRRWRNRKWSAFSMWLSWATVDWARHIAWKILKIYYTPRPGRQASVSEHVRRTTCKKAHTSKQHYLQQLGSVSTDKESEGRPVHLWSIAFQPLITFGEMWTNCNDRLHGEPRWPIRFKWKKILLRTTLFASLNE